eukprot:gene5180-7024_t
MTGRKPSTDTRALIAQMMNDSKLTPFQKRQLEQKINKGQSLPKQVHPTSSAAPKSVQSQNASSETSQSRCSKLQVDTIQHRKPLSAIMAETHAYEQPRYEVKPGLDRDTAREALADELAFGKDVAIAKQNIRNRRNTTSTSSTKASKQPDNDQLHEIDLFDILVKEIEERQEFLRELRLTRCDPETKSRIITEISQRIRQLELLDRKRSKGLSITEIT